MLENAWKSTSNAQPKNTNAQQMHSKEHKCTAVTQEAHKRQLSPEKIQTRFEGGISEA